MPGVGIEPTTRGFSVPSLYPTKSQQQLTITTTWVRFSQVGPYQQLPTATNQSGRKTGGQFPSTEHDPRQQTQTHLRRFQLHPPAQASEAQQIERVAKHWLLAGSRPSTTGVLTLRNASKPANYSRRASAAPARTQHANKAHWRAMREPLGEGGLDASICWAYYLQISNSYAHNFTGDKP